MSWTVRENGSPGLIVSGRTLSLSLSFKWSGREVIETAAVETWIDCMGISCFWPPQRSPLGPQQLTAGGFDEMSQQFPMVIDSRGLAEIERRRAGTGKVVLRCHFNVMWRPVTEIPLQTQDGRVVTLRSLEQAQVRSVERDIVVERDQWLAILKALSWGETEVFEIPHVELLQVDRLKLAMRHLRAAEEALRLGHYPSAVTEARKAVEVAAGVEGNMDASMRKKALEGLAADAFPNGEDDPRRLTLSDLMKSLVHLRNEGGAHGSIRFQVERADAELSLRLALSLFSYLAQHLQYSASNPS